jgi:hypothetical protein
MRVKGMFVASAFVTAFAALGASCQDSGCESALQLDTMAIAQVCTMPPYMSNSAFCSVCSTAGYYSITTVGAGKCVCAPLTYDQAACSDSENANDRLAAARSAVDFADTSCSTVVLSNDGGIVDGNIATHADGTGD